MHPRIQPDAFLRAYVGDRGWGHVLVRRARGPRVALSSVERAIVEAMDGERDEAAIAREAAEASGQSVTARRVVELAARLREAGALLEGDDDALPAPPSSAALELCELSPEEATALRLDLLPGSAFACGGQGGCCRLYDLVMLRPADVAALDEAYGREGHLPGGLTLGSSLGRPRPLQGGDADLFAIASVDGACMVLEADGACGVHRALGALRKPSGCLAFPLRDVLCGDELAVGLAVECRCVVDSAGDVAGADLRPQAEEVLARRVALRRVERVAASVALGARAAVPRDVYAAWRKAAGARLGASRDVVAWALDEAARLEGHERAPEPAAFARRASSVLGEVGELLDAEAQDTAAVYSQRDLQRQLFSWLAEAAARLRTGVEHGAVPTGEAHGERLCAEQALHMHDLLCAPCVSAGLLSLAVRLLLARAAPEGGPEPLLPVTAVAYLQRSSWLGPLLEAAAQRLVAAL